ncbi:MAG: NUDIX domain-containing protein [Alphaproteobacteria bacterium]|nr:NUDIX domain-containing protein [Alphaproteobacteria bacterium]
MTASPKLLTLCLITQPPRILLGMKKRGFGAGRWNGFGGKVSPGETIEDAAKRELQEEAGIEAGPLTRRGIVEFRWQGKPDVLQVHVFHADSFTGDPVESEEMKPQWFAIEDIPYDEMWQDDRYWFPLFLAGKNFRGSFEFDEKDNVINHELHETAEDLSVAA